MDQTRRRPASSLLRDVRFISGYAATGRTVIVSPFACQHFIHTTVTRFASSSSRHNIRPTHHPSDLRFNAASSCRATFFALAPPKPCPQNLLRGWSHCPLIDHEARRPCFFIAEDVR